MFNAKKLDEFLKKQKALHFNEFAHNYYDCHKTTDISVYIFWILNMSHKSCTLYEDGKTACRTVSPMRSMEAIYKLCEHYYPYPFNVTDIYNGLLKLYREGKIFSWICHELHKRVYYKIGKYDIVFFNSVLTDEYHYDFSTECYLEDNGEEYGSLEDYLSDENLHYINYGV